MSSATAAVGRRADIDISDVSRMANDAYFEVWYASEPMESEKIAVSSTTTGENKIELPSDFNEPISASLVYMPSWSTSSSAHSSYLTLGLISIEEADATNPNPSGVPESIAFYNSWIELYPSPNSAYSFQLRYRAHPEDLTSTASVPSLSTEWRKAVELKTREHVANFVGDFNREVKASADYLRYVATLKRPTAKRQRGETDHRFAAPRPRGGRRRAR